MEYTQRIQQGGIKMRDSRCKNNPANQNEDLYEVVGVQNGSASWDRECDFYLPRKILFVLTTFPVTTYRQKHTDQKGIIIKDESIRWVFETMDINPYVLKDIHSFSINKQQIHTCFNAAVSK